MTCKACLKPDHHGECGSAASNYEISGANLQSCGGHDGFLYGCPRCYEINQGARVRPETEGVKHDAGKAPMSLLDRKALEGVAEVLAFGAAKYAAHNWRGGFDHTRLSDAALRHIFAWIDGEDADPESGLSHIAHAQCCLMFLQRMIIDKPERDDRFKEKAK